MTGRTRESALKATKGAKETPLHSTHIIETGTHGRYLVDRPAGNGPFPVIAGFHGYAENAERMLEALIQVRRERAWLLVSIQALNRFYNRGNDVVVANWMTREDREQAIADNVAYVASVVSTVCREHDTTDVLVYAGFSQGVAMAYRAAAFAVFARSGGPEGGTSVPPRRTSIPPGRQGVPPPPLGVIVLAGDLPPDVGPHVALLPPILIGRGTTDHWYTESKALADLEIFKAAGVTPALHVFEGGHVWDPTFVARAGEFLDACDIEAHRHG